jgi:hypothetical protein
MSLDPIKPGGWDPEDVLSSDQMNALQVELLKAIDGEGGGTYTLSAPLVFDGFPVSFLDARIPSGGFFYIQANGKLDVQPNGTLEISPLATLAMQGTLDVANGAELNVKGGVPGGRIDVEPGAGLHLDSGAELDIDCDADFASGKVFSLHGTLDVDDSADINIQEGGDLTLETGLIPGTGAHMNVESGAKIIASGGAEIQVNDADDLKINGSYTAFRLTLTPLFITATAGVPDYQPFAGNIATWVMHDATAAGWIGFALPLPVGDLLTSLTLTLTGKSGAVGHAGSVAPTTRPLFQLVEVTAAGVETVKAFFTDAVTGVAYDSSHAVTLSAANNPATMPHLVTSNRLYCRVRTEGGGTAAADKAMITDVAGALSAYSYRGPNEVY